MIDRILSSTLREASAKLPVIIITGPRQSGKTTLVRAVFLEHLYTNLENPDTREYATADPRGFLQSSPLMIIDEVQRVPNLTSYMQGMVDEARRPAQFILTGSQNFSYLIYGGNASQLRTERTVLGWQDSSQLLA